MNFKDQVSPGDSSAVLKVRNLSINYVLPRRTVHAVREVSFDLQEGEILAIVGESGCGKSTTCLSIPRLLPNDVARIEGGDVWFDDINLLAVSERDLRRIRGARIGMIYQDPLTALNPSMKVGKQIQEAILEHEDLSPKEARVRAVALLERVGIPTADRRMDAYPHEFSGGMRQRAVIAMALSCHPQILIADEPTSALDVTTQAQILELLKSLQVDLNLSVILITHDLGVVANLAQRVLVMYAGQAVECGPTDSIYYHPRHPYTQGLLRSVIREGQNRDHVLETIPGRPPDLEKPPSACAFVPRCPFSISVCSEVWPPMETVGNGHLVSCHVKPIVEMERTWMDTSDMASSTEVTSEYQAKLGSASLAPSTEASLLAVRDLSCMFPVRGVGGGAKTVVRAVDSVTINIHQGESVGLVGESGCGKSTLARAILQLIRTTGGQVLFEGQDITAMPVRALRAVRRHIQIIFQDPYSSLNPKLSVEKSLSEPFLNYGLRPARDELCRLLDTVGLSPDVLRRRPGQLSGGQQQRVVIARALALDPKLLVCDEPTSALDVSIRAQILNLFVELRRRLEIAYLFISHDLGVVGYISDRVAVMYLGRIVEIASSDELVGNPRHPYTRALLSALPVPDPRVEKRATAHHAERGTT